MDPNLTKAQRRQLRELGGMAYERDLSSHLATLESEFVRWRAGEIDAFVLAEVSFIRAQRASSSRSMGPHISSSRWPMQSIGA